MSEDAAWLIRLPEVFSGVVPEVLAALGGGPAKGLGDYRLVKLSAERTPLDGPEGIFIPWCLPLEHAWPCDPRKIDGFIEKAAGGLLRKFGERELSTVWVGTLESGPAGSWFKRLASNLRGRALQMFPQPPVALAAAGGQDPDAPALFCLVGRQGLYAGVATPRACNGFYPGGVRYLPKGTPETISRAGAKVAGALHQLRLYGVPPGSGAHWLELGASPGGMTSELLGRDWRVTAIDRAALDPRLDGAAGLKFFRQDVSAFRVPTGEIYDGLLCDMNGAPSAAFGQVLRLSRHLTKGAWVIFTLKTTDREGFHETLALHEEIRAMAAGESLKHVATSHLSGNRREFTMWWRK